MFCHMYGHAFLRRYMYCIILEERSKMNKKILDVTTAFAFCICLIATAKIGEQNAQEPGSAVDVSTYTVTEEERADATEKSGKVTAGVSSVLSGYSFTTESGEEETSVRKNENNRVSTPAQVGDLTVPYAAVKAAVAEEPLQPQQVQQEAIYTNRWNITLTGDEIDLLAKIVWLESCGEPVSGQKAVVEVIFNRMASDLYPNVLYDVLSQQNPTQFCSWKNRERAKPTEKEYSSIYEVLNGNTNILRNDTLYFSTEPLTSHIDVTIGGHSFCY